MLVSTGKSNKALGIQVSHDTPLGQRCGEIYKRYEAYGLGYSTGFASKAIGVVLKVDDVEALQKDLPGDFVIYSTFSPVAGIIVPRCGRLFAVANSAPPKTSTLKKNL